MLCNTIRRNPAKQLVRAFGASAQMKPIPVKPSLTQLVIDGKFVDSASGKTFSVVDPRTEEPVVDFAEADVEDMNRAVTAARRAFDEGPWPRMSGYERSRVMNKIADVLEANTETLANLETLDNGKPVKYSTHADVALSVQHFRYFAGYCDKIYGQTLPHSGNVQANTYLEPIGVAAQIIPWNFPLLMAAWKLGPSLATGCTSVLKTSEKTPLTGALLGKLCLDAGLPEGVLNVVAGKNISACEALVKDERVDKVAFTGSLATSKIIGRYITEANIKPFTQELGGKSPGIVFPDADIEKAVADSHFGLFFNHGQCCAASSRVFVHESVYDQFLEAAIKAAKARPVGDPFSDVEQGPLVDGLQFDKVMSYVESGKKDGATVAAGGSRIGTKGYFMEPTIFTDVDENSKIWKEEIFGPVMGIAKFSDEDDVIRRANATNFGLAAGMWTNNVNTINRVARGLRAGTIWVNCWNQYDNGTPFGGYKDSGTGREKGSMALNNYLQTKTVTIPMIGNLAWSR